MKKLPDIAGHFGLYGGRYVPETLVKACEELTVAYRKLQKRQKIP